MAMGTEEEVVRLMKVRIRGFACAGRPWVVMKNWESFLRFYPARSDDQFYPTANPPCRDSEFLMYSVLQKYTDREVAIRPLTHGVSSATRT